MLFGNGVIALIKKLGKFLSNLGLVFGLVGILLAFVEKDIDIPTRIFYAVVGVIVCLIAKVKTFRHALISILFLLVSISYVFSLIDGDMQLNATSVLAFLCTLSICIYFGYKVLKHRNISQIDLHAIDAMSGLEFEEYTGKLLRKLGYTDVTVTKASGDQGVDVLATKNGLRYAIQCKNYQHSLDNTSVQEAYAGMKFYGCDRAAVITNSTFTSGAKELANAIGVELWDRQALSSMIIKAKRKNLSAIATVRQVNIDSKNREYEPLPHASVASSSDPGKTVPHIPDYRSDGTPAGDHYHDPMLTAAVDVAFEAGQVSVSILQRSLKLGYARCARLIDEMEALGIVGPFNGSIPRKILISKEKWKQMREFIGDSLPF